MTAAAPPPQALPSPRAPGSPLAVPAFRWLLGVQAGFGLTYSTFLLLPRVLATHAGADADRIGLVMASFGLANVLGAPWVARAIAAFGPRRTLLAANAIMIVAALGFALAPGAGPIAFACRAAQGLAWALAFSAGGALVAALVAPEALGRGVALYSSASLATNALAPALAEPALLRLGPGPVFALAAVPSVFALLAALRLPAPRPPTAAPRARRQPAPDDAGGPGALPARLLVVSGVLGLACAVVFTFHQPLALARGTRQVSGFLVAYTVAALISRLLLGRLSDRLGPARVARASFFHYGAVVAAMIALRPANVPVLGALYGVAHGSFFPAFMTLSLQAVRPADRDRMLSWINATFNGGALAVAGLGLLGARFGWAAVFLPTGALVLLTAALALRSDRAVPYAARPWTAPSPSPSAPSPSPRS